MIVYRISFNKTFLEVTLFYFIVFVFYQVRKRKKENYTLGEELFGLPLTKYPEFEETEREIQMLEKLYSLYVTVINTIKGYGDLFWVDVVE